VKILHILDNTDDLRNNLGVGHVPIPQDRFQESFQQLLFPLADIRSFLMMNTGILCLAIFPGQLMDIPPAPTETGFVWW
jgi:hypothetical protein